MTGLAEAVELSFFGQPGSLRDLAARRLRRDIASGAMRPGTIYSIPALAHGLGMSATPVREAMLDLVRDRLFEAVPNRGFRLVQLTGQDVADLQEVRLLLEPAAVIGVIRVLTPLHCEGLRSVVDDVAAAGARGDVRAGLEAHYLFVDLVTSLNRNAHLVAIIARLRAQTRPHARVDASDLAEMAAEDYQLIDALLAGRTDTVVRIMDRIVSRSSGRPPRVTSDG